MLALVAFVAAAGLPRQPHYVHRHAAGEPGHSHPWDGTRVALLVRGEQAAGSHHAADRRGPLHDGHDHPHGARLSHPGGRHDHAHHGAASVGEHAPPGRGGAVASAASVAKRLDRVAGLAARRTAPQAGRSAQHDDGVRRAAYGAHTARLTGLAAPQDGGDLHDHWQAPFQLVARSIAPALAVVVVRARALAAPAYDAQAAILRALRARSPPLPLSV